MKAPGLKILLTVLFVSAGICTSVSQGNAPPRMVYITGGYYTPLYSQENEEKEVKPFYIDVYPVTNQEFLDFVKKNPEWQRKNVKQLFADRTYLRHWKSDIELGENINPKSPVTNVSWFAARAYAKWKGKRLPSIDEWEYVASASRESKDGSRDSENIKRILEWYSSLSSKHLAEIGSTEKNYWGVYDMFGLIWEWTYDFNNAMVTGESRGDSNLERNLFCGSGSASAGNAENYPAFMRYGFRSSLKANYTVSNLGFRCVKDLKTMEDL